MDGLLGWMTLEIDALLVVDGVALRRTRSGRLALSFPRRTSRRGRQYALVRPRDEIAGRAIEEAVLSALGTSRRADRVELRELP